MTVRCASGTWPPGAPRTLKGHGAAVNAVAVTLDGHSAVSGSDDRTVRVWDLATSLTRATFHADAEVTSCAVSADGQTLAAGDRSGQVHFLRLENGAVESSGQEAPA